jgi:hypothetical protein
MNSYREHRDRMKRQKRKTTTRKVVLVAVGGLLLFGSLFLLFMPSYLDGQRGTVVGYQDDTSATSSRRYLVIRLDGGSTVQARIKEHIPYQLGNRVMVKEITNRVFGYKWYVFREYLDESQSPANTQ